MTNADNQPHQARNSENDEALTPRQSDIDSAPSDTQEQRSELIRREIRQEVVRAVAYSGPVPLPDTLQKYNEVVPGSAKQIMDDAHDQSVHRRELERRYLEAGISNNRRGQWLGFIVVMTIVIGGMLLIAFGKSIEGLALALPGLASLAGAFILSRWRDSQELREKREAFPRGLRDSPEQQTEIEEGP